MQWQCDVTVQMRYPDTNSQNCQENGDIVGEERFCRYSIDNSNWDKINEIPIRWQHGYDYKRSATEYVVQIQLSRPLAYSNIWIKHTDIPLIKVIY